MGLEEILNQNSISLFIHFAILILTFVSIILSLGVVWQAERSLDRSYKYLTVALVFFAIFELITILNLVDVIQIPGFKRLFELVFIFFMTISLFVMNRTLRQVWKEKT